MEQVTARWVLVGTALLAGAAPAIVHGAQPSAKAREAKLIAVLKSDAELKAKAAACRELTLVATADAVPTLAALLGDPKLSHMARYALEPIPDPAADQALRDALGKLKGRPLVGVIGSVGVRRDAKATPALARLLRHADADVAKGAARALGKIGTAAAAKAIEAALASTPKANQVHFCEGLFRCAEALDAKGQRQEAMAIYDHLRALKQPAHQVRTGALRGAVLTRGKAGLPLLLQAIRGDDFLLVTAAARTAMEMPHPEVTKALADELPRLPADKQILVTQALGTRGDAAAALPALLALARKGDKAPRVAAIRAVAEVPGPAAIPVLIALQDDPDADVAKAAQASLAALPGGAVDAAIVAMLDDKDVATRTLAIGLVGQRRIASAVPALVKAAGDADESIRVASIKALGDLAGADQFHTLVGLLVKAKSAAESKAAERALATLCVRLAQPVAGNVIVHRAVYGVLPDAGQKDVTKKVAAMLKAGALKIEATNANFGDPARGTVKKLRIDYTANGTRQSKTVGEGQAIAIRAGATPKACIDALCGALPQAPPTPKLALLRVLRTARGPQALAAVRAATADANAEVSSGATSLLCEWPTVDALPDVIRLASTAKSPKVKILALRGAIRLIPLQDAPVTQKLALFEQTLALVERTEEKRLALAALAEMPAPEALALVVPHLADQGLKEEACLAAVAIAEKLVRRHPAQVAEAMAQVSKTTRNMRTARAARRLLTQARKARPRK